MRHARAFPLTALLLFAQVIGLAQWQQSNGPYTADVRCFALHGTRIFLGTLYGGVYTSTDNGGSWTPTINGISRPSVFSLASNGINVYAETNRGLFRTRDDGQTWVQSSIGITDTMVQAIIVKDNVLFAGTMSSGVFRSTDDGNYWNPVSVGLTNSNVKAFCVIGSELYAGTYGGVFKSTDNGDNWIRVSNGLPNQRITSFAAKGTTLFCGAAYSRFEGGVCRTTDGGGTWTPAGLQTTRVYGVAFCGNLLFAATEYGLYSSTDEGGYWSNVISSGTNDNFNALALLGSSFYLGTFQGVLISSDYGTSWFPANNGLTGAVVTSFAQLGKSLFAGTYGGGVFGATDHGNTWQAKNYGLARTYIDALAISGNNIIAGTELAVHYSSDAGAQWQYASMTGVTTDCEIFSVIKSGNRLFAGGYDWFSGTGGMVFRSTDDGVTWAATPGSPPPSSPVISLTAYGSSVYAVYSGRGVLRSTNEGSSWTTISTTLPSSSVRVVYAIGPQRLLVGTGGDGLFQTMDDGGTWTAVNNGLTNRYIYAIGLVGSCYCAGTDGGLFRSTDGGFNWSDVSAGLPGIGVRAFVDDSSYAYVGLQGGSVWRRPVDEMNFPIVVTGGASQVGQTYATLGGIANPNGSPTFVSFEYGPTTSYGLSTSFTSVGSGNSPSPVSALVTDLNPGTIYHFRIVARNNLGTVRGNDSTFMPGAVLPGATTGGAAEFSTTGARVNGTVNPHGYATSYLFQFGPTSSYGQSTPSQDAGLGTNPVTATWLLSGLSSGSLHHYRLVATNIAGSVYGNDSTFWTLPSVPGAGPATSITAIGFTANWSAQVGATGYRLDVATDTLVTALLPGYSNLDVGNVTANAVSGLLAGTVYYYRVRASNQSGVSANSNVTRTITLPPAPLANAASSLTTTGFTANWNPVTRATGYRLDVATDNQFTAFVAPYNNSDVGNLTSIAVPGLSPGTTYFYRVRAVNESGSGASSNVIVVATPPNSPNTPTALQPTGITSSLFSANWTAVSGAIEYRLDVATDNGFSAFVAGYNDLSAGNATSRSVSGLAASTPYYYRVRAVNTGGTSGNSNVMPVMTLPDAPAAPTANAATNVDKTGFTAHWTASSGATTYRFDVSTDNGFAAFVAGYNNVDVGNVTSIVVTGLSPGTVYYYRVRAANSGGTSPSSNAITLTTVKGTQTIQAVIPFSSAKSSLGEYTSVEYQLIGLPGNSGQLISDFLAGQQGVNWEIYWDNGAQVAYPNYYVRFNTSDPAFLSSAGRAYWLLHLGNWVLSSREVTSSTPDSTGAIIVALTPGVGYSLITNPLPVPVAWSAVAALNGINDSIRTWVSGTGWARASSFDPYIGYLFFNSQNKPSLRIPSAGLKVAAGISHDSRNEWRIDVSVKMGQFLDQTTSFGVSPDALPGFDKYEQRKPRHFAEIPDAYFARSEWDEHFSEFSSDIRPPTSDVQEWDIVVRSDHPHPVEVAFDGISSVPAGLAVFLVDAGNSCTVDLHKETRYGLRPLRPITHLAVLVGKEEAVREKTAAVLPRAFTIMQNFPNPFNPGTTVPVAVPFACRVRCDVYNLLGERVASIFDGQVAAGIQHFLWDGRNEHGFPAPTGTYFFRVAVESGVMLTGKMSLIR